jgi:hypothetical protein
MSCHVRVGGGEAFEAWDGPWAEGCVLVNIVGEGCRENSG